MKKMIVILALLVLAMSACTPQVVTTVNGVNNDVIKVYEPSTVCYQNIKYFTVWDRYNFNISTPVIDATTMQPMRC